MKQRTVRALAIATFTGATTAASPVAAKPDSRRGEELQLEEPRQRTVSESRASGPYTELEVGMAASPYAEKDIPRVPWSYPTSGRTPDALDRLLELRSGLTLER